MPSGILINCPLKLLYIYLPETSIPENKTGTVCNEENTLETEVEKINNEIKEINENDYTNEAGDILSIRKGSRSKYLTGISAREKMLQLLQNENKEENEDEK